MSESLLSMWLQGTNLIAAFASKSKPRPMLLRSLSKSRNPERQRLERAANACVGGLIAERAKEERLVTGVWSYRSAGLFPMCFRGRRKDETWRQVQGRRTMRGVERKVGPMKDKSSGDSKKFGLQTVDLSSYSSSLVIHQLVPESLRESIQICHQKFDHSR
jgi:hypothetical protein